MNEQIQKRPLFNLAPVLCPKCGTKQPVLRVPKSTREIFKGGWTCKQCGCEMDKFGKKISTTTSQ